MASLGILTSGVAHEINNPLNYLMGASVGLESYFDQHESHDKKRPTFYYLAIDSGVERISKIVKGLNQFSRNSESMDEDCDVHSILKNCFAMLSNQSKHKSDIIEKYLVAS